MLTTQDAQRTSRKDVALTFCALEPVSIIEKPLSALAWQGMITTSSSSSLPFSFRATMYCKSRSHCSCTLEALLVAALPIDTYVSSVTVSLSASSVTAVG